MYGNYGRNQPRDDDDSEASNSEDEDVSSFGAWVPDEAIEALNLERTIHPEENEKELARRLMKENLGAVTMNIINTAMHGANERVRLDASKYIVERVLGKIGDDAYDTVKSPLEELIEDVTTYVHAQAKS